MTDFIECVTMKDLLKSVSIGYGKDMDKSIMCMIGLTPFFLTQAVDFSH